MTKKTMKRRGGGRKPGTWELVQPPEIRAYRDTYGLSRKQVAETLGVSPTTVVNWEAGKGAAARSMQERIKALLGSGPPATAAPSSRGHGPSGYDSRIEATGRIVAALLGSAKLNRDELGAVIQQVRSALS